MKKLIIIIVVLVLAGGAYYFLRGKSTPVTPLVRDNDVSDFKPDPSNATFVLEDQSVTLSNGRSETSAAPGSALLEETVLMDKFAYGDLNADDKEDTALLLVQSGGGSGTFIYVAVYVSGPVNYKGTNAIFLGDRIAPQSISINQGAVTVTYLDRKPDEPLSAEPTVSESKQFVYRNGEFVER